MENAPTSSNFIRNIVMEDLNSGKTKQIVTRFPPEPNGYLHIGHAKAICLNFELADEFGGRTNLRFDDTNPLKEDREFVEAIQADVRWLGFEWDGLFYASDYFEAMYEAALRLIRKGLAYVEDWSAGEIRAGRGTLTKPGQASPARDRSVAENLDLFARMRNGEFGDGEKVLRAKIDMASPNMNLRDPVLYRISHTKHHHAGDAWCIYPLYDFAHPLEDAIEGVTHSLCSLEFADHRPLYDWVIRECEMESRPRQYEFARLELTNTLMSKRKLRQLVEENAVDGWDDPRMPTISGLRRRGYTPESIRSFTREIGVAKSNSVVDVRMLEHFIREDLKLKAPRTMAVVRPLKVVITNYPEGQAEMLDAENNPENPEMGSRQIPFSREIYIEQDDFMEHPPNKYFRLFPGNEVRLKHAYFIKCHDFVKDADGNVTELHCTYDPETKSGSGFTGRKVKGTIHWVEAKQAVGAEFRIYNELLREDAADASASGAAGGPGSSVAGGYDAADGPGGGAEGGPGGNVEDAVGSGEIAGEETIMDQLNPDSLQIFQGFVEPNMQGVQPQDKFQFFRHGYFNVDPKYTTPAKPVFNRIVSLKSSF